MSNTEKNREKKEEEEIAGAQDNADKKKFNYATGEIQACHAFPLIRISYLCCGPGYVFYGSGSRFFFYPDLDPGKKFCGKFSYSTKKEGRKGAIIQNHFKK